MSEEKKISEPRKYTLKWEIEELAPEDYLVEGVTRVKGLNLLYDTLVVSMQNRLARNLRKAERREQKKK
ncbi:MAG: hypothetical protein KGN01_06860 [Patescibacteria group bacterium]|nr:hypothetical protein [Patescibacteria group bacterium]